MIVRLLLAALAAGLIAGLVMTPAQYTKLVPLIIQAEAFEAGGAHSHEHDHSAAETAATDNHDHQQEAAGDQNGHSHDDEASVLGFGRLGNTILANIAAGCGFALLLAGAAFVSGITFPSGREAVKRGLLLGAAGWFAIQLAPAWGLPPELPGFPYIDLVERQIWWIATVLCSAVGLYLIALRPEWIAWIAGVVLIIAPHMYGAPHPADISSEVPAMLASEYATAALGTTLFFWLVLGGVLGYFLSRLDSEGQAV